MGPGLQGSPWAKQILICITLTSSLTFFLLSLISITWRRSTSKAFVAYERERATEHKGLILWSYGRSATGSLMKSLRTTANFTFCNGDKESFMRGPYLSSSGFQDCMNRGELLVHITPTDLTLKKSTLRTPYEVFQAAYKAGFRTLVTIFRQNQLARDVSAYRQGLRKEGRVVHMLDGVEDLTIRFEDMKRFWIHAVEAAREIGLTMVPCSFPSLVEDVCPCVRTALATLSSLSKENSSKCQRLQVHAEDSKKNKTLESLMPPELAAWMRGQVIGTAYEWMLNLEAEGWPKDIAPPVPMPTWLPDGGRILAAD
eukprot:Skav210464  [mRNA]  locus=scaffold1443:136657:137595:- [translate_table: standard]